MSGRILRALVATGLIAGPGLLTNGSVVTAQTREARAVDSATFVFRDVTVLPMTGPVALAHQSVVVRGDRIVAVGDVGTIEIPPGSTIVDGAGKYLMPGLADMRIRLPGPDSSGTLTRNTLALLLANGVTTVRVMAGNNRHLIIRDSISRGLIPGPRMYVAGNPVGALPGFTADLRRVLTRSETSDFVDSMKRAGYDFIQVNATMLRQEYEALAAAARRAGILLTGTVPPDAGLDRVIRAHQASIDNLDGYLAALERDDSPVRLADPVTRARRLLQFYDSTKIPRLAASLREAGVANTPMLFVNHVTFTGHAAEVMAEWPEMKYVAPTVVRDWIVRKNRATDQQANTIDGPRLIAYRNMVTRGLAAEGARILVGSEANGAFLVPGFSTLYEIHSLTVAGVPIPQALRAATRSAAEFLGAERDFGVVTPGVSADLLLLDANPLVDVANLTTRAGVMVRGKWFPRAELDSMLEQVAKSYKGGDEGRVTRDE